MDGSLEPEMGRNTETQTTETPVTPEKFSPSEPPRQEAPWSDNKGLAASRHNPLRPQTPVRQQVADPTSHPPHLGTFVPRDVANIPWCARTGSTPQSMRSQSTLSSSPPSPIVHPALPGNAQEPAIRSRADSAWTSSSPKRKLLPDGYARNNSYDAEEDRDDENERSGLLSDGRGPAAN
ncbi:hypothetical protein B0T26DRAFT_334161 [Lasiosphaeria miniovina]|uniref:Uncharacterized protein n=1 Tax=Lasiosphaeria miniovina TaxID=1954250 RepID=A0AA40DW76_9PEZI|nr:uncharacterized protein B0T26DRAFT_334161 [Lasiosphaeria miniovina]KAK0718624.1 hypothetical protein B0T26DRAFT_334161 [Lasiosphaeria miniovina]